MEAGTYGEPVLLVGRSGSRGELGGVGGSELQTVALHSSRLGHVGQQVLQRHVLLLPEVVPCSHTPHKVHLHRKQRTLSCYFKSQTQSISPLQSALSLRKLLLSMNLNYSLVTLHMAFFKFTAKNYCAVS